MATALLANISHRDDVQELLLDPDSGGLEGLVGVASATCQLLTRVVQSARGTSMRSHRRLMRNLCTAIVDSVLIVTALATEREECVCVRVLCVLCVCVCGGGQA